MSRLKVPKISHMHPSSMFFQAWSHRGEKTTPPLPSLHCSVSRDRPVTGKHLQMSRCQDGSAQSVEKAFLDCVLDCSGAGSDLLTPYTHTARINPQNCSTGLFIKPTSSHIACICVCSCSPVAGADGHPHPEDLQGGGGPETMAR